MLYISFFKSCLHCSVKLIIKKHTFWFPEIAFLNRYINFSEEANCPQSLQVERGLTAPFIVSQPPVLPPAAARKKKFSETLTGEKNLKMQNLLASENWL